MERERLASITEGARERIVGEEVDRPRGGGDDETPDPEMDRTGRHHRRTVTDSEQTDGSEEDTANATYQQASSDSSDDYALLERIFGPQREPVSGVERATSGCLPVPFHGGTARNFIIDGEQTDGRDENVASATNPQDPSESSEDTAELARRMLAQLPVPGNAQNLVTEEGHNRLLSHSQPMMLDPAIHAYDIAATTAVSDARSLTRLDAGFSPGTLERPFPGAPSGPGSSELPGAQLDMGEDLVLLPAVDVGLEVGDDASEAVPDVHYFDLRYRNNFRESLAAALADMGMMNEVIADAVVDFDISMEDDDSETSTDVIAHLQLRVGDRNQLVISHARDPPIRPNDHQAVSNAVANSNGPIDDHASESLTDAIANLELRVGDNNHLDIAHALGNRDLPFRPNHHRTVSGVSSTPTPLRNTDTPPGTAIPRGPNSTVSSDDIARMPPNPFNEARAREARARHPKRKLGTSITNAAGSAARVRLAVNTAQPTGEVGSQVNPLLSQPMVGSESGSSRARLPSFLLGEAAMEPPVHIHDPSGIPVIYESVSSSASECEGNGKGKAKAKSKKHKKVAFWATKLSLRDVMEQPEPEEIPELDVEVWTDAKQWKEGEEQKRIEEWYEKAREAQTGSSRSAQACPGWQAETDRAQRDQQAREAMAWALKQVQAGADASQSNREAIVQAQAQVVAEGSFDQTDGEGVQPEVVVRVLAQIQADLEAGLEGGGRDAALEMDEARARDEGVPIEGIGKDAQQPLVDSGRGTGPPSDVSSLGMAFYAHAPGSPGNSTGDLARLVEEVEGEGKGKGKGKMTGSM